MLTTQLFLLGLQRGIDGTPNQASIGAVILEDDTALPTRNVSGLITWGDGTDTYAIAVQPNPFWAAASVDVTRRLNVATVTLNPAPYTGTFSLYYDSEQISGINYNASAAQVQAAISNVTGPEHSVIVGGQSPQWLITFESDSLAAKLSAGADTLFAPVTLPTHIYPTGDFMATITARNYRSPRCDTATDTLRISFTPESQQIIPAPILLGPVIAADSGFPNPQQWNFNVAVDLQVLASNVKMILITEPGERTMMPEFGCALRQFIFNPLLDSTANDIAAECRRAIMLWEPRVRIADLTSTLSNTQKSITVNATLVSLLNQQQFQLNIELER